MTGIRADEFLGLTLPQATELANAGEWELRDMDEFAWHTSDRRTHRVNVWVEDGVITRAEVF